MTEQRLRELAGGVAIIGVAGRFPGAANIPALWEMLKAGHSAIRRFEPHELDDDFDAATRADPNYVPARPIIDGIDQFDAEFFGYNARDAALTDPQQRVFLECVWSALEDAGYDPKQTPGAIGVFAGSSLNTYFLRHVLQDRSAVDVFTSNFQVGSYQELMGALQDFVATRVAYKLDLRGPAVNVQSACSTSLLAVAQAVQSLQLFSSDMAIAGGVSITLPQQRGYIHSEGGMASADGTCRPFDANATGTIFGSGAGVVVLKRVEDAVQDGDHIYAVIRGVGVNNDGAGKVGFTAPSAEGQAEAIAAALAVAGVEPDTIGYVEAHGTATPLGDPIEFRGLQSAFETANARNYCWLGSIKANVGHLDAAAGVAGLIKTALALDHELLPPQINFERVNSNIQLDQSPFKIATTLTPWPRGSEPRRAGVSAFGVGGTNVHLVLEESPVTRVAEVATTDDHAHLLVVSGRSEASAKTAALALSRRFADAQPPSLSDAAYTLRSGRRAFPYRIAVAARTRDCAIAGLTSAANKSVLRTPDAAPKLLFMFPGQGAQYPGMGQALYRSEPIFKQWVDRGLNVLEPMIGPEIRSALFDTQPLGDDDAHPIRSTLLAQPALFVIEHALAQLLMSRGAQPNMMIGHSLGEFVAATIAGVMSFDDALRLIAARGQAMRAQPPGAMLAVRAPLKDIESLLPVSIEIAAVNAPELVTVAGSFEDIADFEEKLAARDVPYRRLHTSHAFHSAAMLPVVAALRRALQGMTLHAPRIPIVSSVTGQFLTDTEAMSPDYWAQHARVTVRFADAYATAVAGDPAVAIEAGPGRTLATFAQQSRVAIRPLAIVPTLPEFSDRVREVVVFSDAVGQLWRCGVDVTLGAPSGGQRVSLPGTPFEHKRYWIDRKAASTSTPMVQARDMAPTIATANLPSPAVPELLPIFHSTTLPLAPQQQPTSMIDHKATLTRDVTALLEDISGETIEANATQASFLELGFDSLLLGQVAQRIQKTYSVKLTFRQLLGAYPSIDALVTHLASVVPAPTVAAYPSSANSKMPTLAAAPVQVDLSQTIAPVSASAAPSMGGGHIEALMRDQLATMQAIFSQQLQALSPSGAAPTVATAVPTASVVTTGQAIAVRPSMPSPLSSQSATDEAEGEGRFKIYRAGAASTGSSLSPAQQALVSDLVRRTDTKFATSKARAQASRRVLADPRSASGFRAEWKELIYPIIAERSKGSKLYDADGNTLIDLVNGYGQTAFGHAPDFVTSAISAQMEKGFAIGPQTPLAAEVAEMFCAITGNERATFCNTGSEAVMAGMRIARAVTGRNKVVFFGGAYHGQFDEVLAKGLGKRAKGPGAAPVAPGIPREAVSNMVVLSYDNPESLAWVKANIDDIAAVLVETVQSRHPALVPTAFIRELRDVTAASGAALIFDEVVTGFRVHPGGMQSVLGIKADLATYGKVVGGGMPIGVLAGTARFMDALDGGYWQFGDDSVPEVAPTFFAGTFVRHPLVLAAAKAVLEHVKAEGPQMQERLAATTAGLVERLNTALTVRGIQTRVERYSSWFYMNPAQEDPLASLLYPLMRLEGVHVYEGFPCFLTTAHSIADIDVIVAAFETALDQLQRAGILSGGASIDAMIAPPLALTMAATVLPDRVPLTEPQQEIYLAAQLGDAASTAFNESVSVRLTGEIEHEAMARALNDVVARHDALRGRFGDTGEMMDVAPSLAIALPLVDLSSASDTDAALAQRLAIDAAQPFDLAQGPLVRAQLVRLSMQSYVFVFTAHHIICDGWSINVILNELAASYAARRRGTTASFETALPYRQYALDLKNKPAATATDAFWSGMYKTIPPPLELPGDRARTLDRSWRGATTSAMIERDILRGVKAAAGKQGASLFVALFSALQTLMGRLSGSSDVALAVPMAGQTAIEDEVLVGHCVNFLPVRVDFDPEQSFAQHLKSVNATMMQAYEHQDTTLGRIVRTLGLKRGVGRTPITDVQFNLEKLGDGLAFDGVPATITPNPKSAVNFDLFFNFIEGRDGLRVDVDYNTDLYDAATIERWIGHLRILLSAIATDSQTAIARLPLMDATRTRWLISDLNQTREAYQSGQRVDEIISAQARRTPHAIAVTFGDQSLTYADLEAASNKLASAIRNVVPKPGARVALAVHRSLDMLLALLAIMKAGHTYVPLDPTHPKTRLRQTLDAARVSLLVTNDVSIGDIAPNGVAILDLNQRRDEISWGSSAPLNIMTPPDASAYVIFTSGSTGIPKGVEVGHRAVVNFLASMAKTPGFTARDRLLAVTTVCFDISGLELYLPLTVGGTVVIASREAVADGFQLVEMISQQRISVVQATPSLWQMLVEAGFEPRAGLKMLVGGEPLPRDLADQLTANGGELWNLYGPTETTIWSSTCMVGPGAIHIGSPIANTELYILDPTDQLAPIGVAGELYIGGDGLARGYFDRPDLTAAAFRTIALAGGTAQRLYRTGDIGRRLADGTIQLFGRRDSQVKLRGYRIELEDIEAMLRTADGVAHAAVGVAADDPTAPRLIGYIVPRAGQTIERGALAAHVGRHLPDYMVPSKWVLLDALPMTGNGKLDRKALPSQAVRAEAGAATTSVALAVAPAVAPEPIVDLPRAGVEERIAAVWREVLQVSTVARDISILAYGADSLHIFRIAARLQNQGLRLQARHLLTLPTIAQQAAHVGTFDDTPDTAAVPPSLQAYRRGQNRTQR